jgi:hypothetical protein
MRKLSLLLCVCLSACFKTYTTPVERPRLDLPPPPSVTLQSVKFRVIHKHNADKFFNDVDKNDGKEPVVVALSVQDYKKMALNLAKLKAYIKSQQKIISLYKRYYEANKNGNKEAQK